MNPPHESPAHPPHRPALEPKKPIPTIGDMVGAAVAKIGTYNQLDNKQQKVALIDQEMCINCGESELGDVGRQIQRADSNATNTSFSIFGVLSICVRLCDREWVYVFFWVYDCYYNYETATYDWCSYFLTIRKLIKYPRRESNGNLLNHR